MIDLPKSSRNCDSILVVVDKVTRMASCNKGIIDNDTARLLWNTMIKLYGVPRAICNDRES